MSNPNLSLRAEQAVIGALLQEPAKREEIAYLRADRFTHPTYRALYSELITGAAAKTAELPGQLADRLRIPGVSAVYLRDLAASGPAPADITVYARMVQEAYVRAQLAVHVDRIAVSAVQAGGTQPGLDRLAQALARQVAPPAAEIQVESAPPTYGQPVADAEYAVPVESRARQEELVLADLLQNGDQVAEVQVWLSSDSFEPGPRREVYDAILTVYEQGEPVNELTVAWQLGRDSSAVVYAEEVEVRQEPAGPEYLGHLMATAVVVGAAVEIGHELFVHDLRTELAADASRIVSKAEQAESAVTPAKLASPPTPAHQPAQQEQQQLRQAAVGIQQPPVQPVLDNQPKIRP